MAKNPFGNTTTTNKKKTQEDDVFSRVQKMATRDVTSSKISTDYIPRYSSKTNAMTTPTVNSTVGSPTSAADTAKRKKEIEDRLGAIQSEYRTTASVLSGYQRGGMQKSNAYLTAKDMADRLLAEKSELEKELESIQYTEKYSTKVYDDNFFGQFGASMARGNIQEDESLAWNEYVKNPTEENKQKAQTISDMAATFQQNNKAALADDATAPLISQSLAGYLPQLWGQTKASAVGGAAGGAAGAAVGSVVPVLGTAAGAGYGIKAGIVAGSGKYSYDTMRGAAFKGLLDAGVPEEVARAAANDEAVISAMIEMADTGVDIATLGVGGLIKTATKGSAKAAAKAVAKEGAEAAAESAMKKFAKALGGYGLNIAGEYAEEYAQETVSMANQQRMSGGSADGVGDLAAGSVGKLFDMTAEEREQAHAAGMEGAKIAMMMGGATSIATNTTNAYLQNKQGKIYNADIDALIEEGLQSDPSTEAYKLATQAKATRDSGGNISNIAASKLAEANSKAIKWETSKADYEAQQTVDNSSPVVESSVEENPVPSRMEVYRNRLTESGMDATKAEVAATSIERILSGDTTITNKDKDVLTVGNKEARAIFEEETGVKLPASNSSTRKAISEYVAQTAMKHQEQTTETVATETAKPVENVMTAWQNQKTQEEKINQLKGSTSTFGVTTNSAEATLRQAAEIASTRSKVDNAVTVQRNMTSLGANGQRVYQKHLQNAKSVSGFSNAFQRYYDAGMIGGLQFDDIKTAYDDGVSRSVLYEAYIAGQNDAAAADRGKPTIKQKSAQKGKKTPSKGKGRFYDNRTSAGKSVDEKTNVALRQFAKVFNIDIELVDSIDVGKHKSAANGYYDRAANKIVLAADSDNPLMVVLKHEVTHYLQRNAPEQYKAFKDYVMKAYYGNSQDTMNLEIQLRINDAASKGVKLTRSQAMDEIVSDATEAFMTDRDSIDALVRENRSLAETILNAIRDVLKKIEAAMKGEKLQGYSDFMNADQLKQAEKMWVEALAAAAEGREIGIDFAEITESSAPVWSLKSMKFDLLDGQMQRDLVEHGIMTVEESQHLMDEISKLIDDMSPFAHIVDMNEEYTKGNRPFNVYKPNSDPLYKVSLDFSTLCKKRLMTQFVMESLQTKLGKALSAKEQLAIRSKLEEYGKTNQQIQVACALCYVEARRLKAPDQINRFLDDRTTILTDYFGKKNKEYKASVDAMADRMKVEMGYKADTKLKNLKPADKKKINTAKQKMMKEYIPSAEEQKIIERANAIDNKEFLSQAGLTNLSLNDPVIYDAFVTHVRNATKSKALESGVPYYYGDSKSVSDALIDAMNAENGLRHQSWSDFEIVHLLDNIAAVIELSVRKAKMHAYTKVPDFVHVNGKTGIMINLSLIPAGKTGIKDGKLDFSPTEGMDYQVAVDLRKQYHKTAGTIAIGIDDQQIAMMLDDQTIDYVIPYHTSGMNAQLRKMAGISGWLDYETYQNEKEIKGAEQGDCPDELWHKKPDFSEWFDTSKLDMSKSGVEIMREAAGRYLVLCEERGLTPKFSDTKKHTDFSKHENYWKLLIDRKMVDKDGNIIIQQAVRPDFDFGKISEIVQTEIKNYDPTLLDSINEMISAEWESGGIKQREKELLAEEKKAKKAKKKAAKVANGLLEQVVAPDQAQKNTTDDGGVKYSYESLIAKDPIKVVTVKERPIPVRGKKVDRGAVSAIALADANAQSDEMGNTQRYVHIPDIDGNVLLNKKGVEHGLLGNKTNSGTVATAEVTGDLVNILRNSIAVNQRSPRSAADGDFSYILFGYAKNENGQEYIVRSTVNHFPENKSVVDSVEIYDVLKGSKAKKMETELMRSYSADAAAVHANSSNSNYTLSVSDLLEVVKDNYPELLSKDVLSHFNISEDVQEDGLQYSFKDSDYMAAVERGDMETAQKMVDEAAKAAGYWSALPVYHGTNAEFSTFRDSDRGYFFTTSDAVANSYGHKVNKVYLDLGYSKSIDGHGKTTKGNYDVYEMARDAFAEEYDSIVLDNVLHAGANYDAIDGLISPDEVAHRKAIAEQSRKVFEEFEKKLLRFEEKYWVDVMPETEETWRRAIDRAIFEMDYDESQRAKRDAKTLYEYADRLDALSKEISTLTDQIRANDLDPEMRNRALNAIIVVKNKAQIKSADPVTYDDNGNVIPLSERFNAENNDIRYQLKTPEEMADVAKQIRHEAKAVTDAEIMSQAIKDLKLTDEERSVVRNYQNAVKKLADYEQKLAVYEETKAEHGKGRSFYTDASGKVKKSGVKYSAAERAEIQRKVEWWKKQLREIEQRENFKKILKREKAKMAEAHAKKVSDLRAKYDQKLSDLRAKRDEKVEAEKQKMRDYKQHQRDSKEYKALKGKLEADVQWLSERLVHPTDSKHIPDKFRGLVAKFLETLDFTTKGMDKHTAKTGTPSNKVIKLWSLVAEYQKIALDDAAELVLTPLEEDMVELIQKTVDGKKVEDLTYEELRVVRDIIRYIKAGVASADKAFNKEIKESISAMGEALIQEQRSKKAKKDRAGILGGADKLMNYDNVAPADKFHEFGGVMEKLYHEIRKGFDKHISNVQSAIAYTQDLIKGKDAALKEWSGDKAKVTKFQISDGTTIELTPAQVMSLYCLMKREQAVGHVLGSGIVPSGVVVKEAKKFGKLKVNVAKKISAERSSRCTYEDIQKIVSTLTADQKKIADGVMNLFTTKCADWGNETSMKLYGYKKFNEPNYFPIRSSDAYLNARFDDSGDVLIKNLGFTKNTVVNANNPIVVEDIFDVLADHVNKMSMYNALVVPLTDFTRVFNYKNKRVNKDGSVTINDSVQKALETSGGNLGIAYIKQFMKDVNKQANSLAAESFINQSISRYKKAKIAASARVLLQQPTAITRAAAMVDPKYLIKGLQQKANYKEMFDNSEIAYWKSLGFYQTDMGRNMKDILLDNESKLDRLTMGMYGKADDFAWGHLWNAIKLEQADAHPDMDTTSSEFLDLVADRFDEVVDRTQVVDSVFHRSQIMRAQGAATKIATAFMSEPTKAFNLLRTDLIDSIDSKDYSKIKRSAVTYVANAVLVSAFAGIADMIRDDEDEDEEGEKRTLWDKYRDAAIKYDADAPTFQKLTGNIVDNINPLGMIPYVKEINSMIQGYDINRMEMASLAEFVKTAKKWTTGKYSYPYLLKETAEDFAELLGIPVKNALRDIFSLVRTAGNIVGGHYYETYMVDKMKYNISNSANRSVFYKHYTDALLAGDTAAAEAILADMVMNGIPYDNIISKGYQKQKEAAFSEARKLIAAGKTEDAKKLIRQLAKQYGKKYTTLWKAVKNGDSADDPEETYDFKDLQKAIRKGEDTELIEDYLTEYGGYSEEDLEEAVKLLTERYK